MERKSPKPKGRLFGYPPEDPKRPPLRRAIENRQGRERPPDSLSAREVADWLRGLFFAWPDFNELGCTCVHNDKRGESVLVATRRVSRERFGIIVRKLDVGEGLDD